MSRWWQVGVVIVGALFVGLTIGVAIWQRVMAQPDSPDGKIDQETLPAAEIQPGEGSSKTQRPVGRAAAKPDRDLVDAARDRMAQPVVGQCGPYELWTDVSDSQVLELCGRIGSALEETYSERLGVRPVGQPRGAVLLFARLETFRGFASSHSRLRAGYAGFSRPVRGVVVLHADVPPATLAGTLAHELAHLVHRRAFGSDQPPWLSEGLADAIGDAVSEEGLSPLAGFVGVEPQRSRLLSGYQSEQGQEVLPLRRLVDLSRDQFDRGIVSFDYEQSALLVRFLLLDSDLGEKFRGFLRELANGSSYDSEALVRQLERSWDEFEAAFQSWLTTGD